MTLNANNNHSNSKCFVTGGYMLGYFTTSIMTNIYTTFLFNKKQYHFPFPLLAGSAFDVIQAILASIGLVLIMKDLRAPIKIYKSITRKKYLTTIVPCAIASTLDIALSNSSLKHISLSMYTMVKSSAPIFVMLSSFIFGLEKPNLQLILIITIIAFGTVLTVRDEFKFNLYGVLLCFAAALSSGIRWSLTQIIIEYNLSHGLQEDPQQRDMTTGPVHTIFFLSPIIAIVLGILSLIFDGFNSIIQSDHFNNSISLGITATLFMIGGIITFILILAEYKVVEDTSVLTFSISGIIKELVIIGLSVAIFKDNLTLINYVGAGLSIFGILLYHYHRTRSIKSDISVNDLDLQRMKMEAVITTDSNVFITSYPKEDHRHQIRGGYIPFFKWGRENKFTTIGNDDNDNNGNGKGGGGHFRNRSTSFTGNNEIPKSYYKDNKRRSGSLDRSNLNHQND
jgi:solute carrier family 35, member C2